MQTFASDSESGRHRIVHRALAHAFITQANLGTMSAGLGERSSEGFCVHAADTHESKQSSRLGTTGRRATSRKAASTGQHETGEGGRRLEPVGTREIAQVWPRRSDGRLRR